MMLTKDELRSLVGLTHQSPHTLLGMHPLGDGSGPRRPRLAARRREG